ncbi:MAG: VWA domain-containing protein [Sedimentisphaerales bacterium]
MNEEIMELKKEDLLLNPTSRVPVALCLDISGSMTGEPIDELNEGIRLFFDALRGDAIAKTSAEVAIVTFSDQPEIKLDFQSLDRFDAPPVLMAGGSTDLGGGVRMALDKLETRKNEYKQAGIDYFQPWLVLMTDGQPTTENHLLASAKTIELETQGKLVVFPIGVGSAADMKVLSMFSKKRQPLRLRGLNFPEFFEWLSKSVVKVSHSRPGEKVETDVGGIKGWAEI